MAVAGWALTVPHSEAAAPATPRDSVTTRPLVESTGGLIDLALAPNGQRLYGLSTDGERVVAIDCGRDAAGAMRVVLVGDAPDGPGSQLGCIDTGVVAVLRTDAEAVITTHRIPPSPEAASAAEPLQRVTLDNADAQATADTPACLTVSPTRNWLAVTAVGVDRTPVLLQAAIAGVRVGSFSPRNSPALQTDEQILAVTAGASDDLVLVTAERTPESPAAEEGTATLGMYATPGGWELLQLDTGLRSIRDVCSSGSSNTLWVITGGEEGVDSPQPAGLWRLDAVIRDRRQAIQAVLMVPLVSPLALAAGKDDVVYVAVDDGNRILEIRALPPGEGDD